MQERRDFRWKREAQVAAHIEDTFAPSVVRNTVCSLFFSSMTHCSPWPWLSLGSKFPLVVKGYQVYKIDLATLLRLFEEFQRSGSLRAEVPRGTFGLKEAGTIQIDLVNGKVVACSLKKKDGNIHASGNNILQMAQQAQGLKWQVLSDVPSATDTTPRLAIPPPRYPHAPSAPPPAIQRNQRSPVPRRTVTPSHYILGNLTFRQRRLLILIDGTRTAGQLAHLLSLSAAEIQEALNELKSMGLIVMEH